MEFKDLMEFAAKVSEVAGVAVIILGGAYGLIRAALKKVGQRSFFDLARSGFGRPLLLGLEVLVAADIIETVTIDRTLESVAALGILVLVRVVLSFSLDVEIDGMFPWRRAQLEATLPPAAEGQ